MDLQKRIENRKKKGDLQSSKLNLFEWWFADTNCIPIKQYVSKLFFVTLIDQYFSCCKLAGTLAYTVVQ